MSSSFLTLVNPGMQFNWGFNFLLMASGKNPSQNNFLVHVCIRKHIHGLLTNKGSLGILKLILIVITSRTCGSSMIKAKFFRWLEFY